MTNYREKLIIAADDFGISELANRNILELAEAGKLDRVAVMSNGRLGQSEAEKIKSCGASLDLHLDCEKEVKKERRMKEGVLARSIFFFLKYFFGRISAPVMELEWEKQIEKFHSLFGQYPDGLNSHQYIHFLPAYFKIILKLAKKYGISYLRFGKISLRKNNSNVYRILNQLHKKDAESFAASSLDSSDHLVSLDWIKDWDKFLENLPEGKTEIVCHPERKEELEIIKRYF